MVINDQIRQLQEVENALNRSIADKKQELSGLTRTIELTKKTVTDAGKMIFNRSEIQNAKRLIVWIDGYISPRVMDVKKNLKLTISYTISQWGDMTEKCWSQSCWNDADGSERWSGYNEYFDPKYGIKFDLSDEQIMEITYERQRNFRFDENKIAITPDEYLTIDNLQRKREYEANKKVRTIEQAKKDLEKAQEQYTKLIAETVVS
jgi:hydroxymethylpyrimidine pyrophosphatase-like HAD family hydrolase